MIVVCLKPILSRCISNEQFGFLEGRQIHEAIRVAQETIHSVKLMKRNGAVVKIDLSKAYDRISWTYLRMLLTHLGFKIEFINWIMGCINSVSYVVLINRAASPFFKGQDQVQQISLSQKLTKAKINGVESKINGVESKVNGVRQ